MSCTRTWQVEAVLDGRLGGAEKASFERHAATCADCQAERRSLAALEERMRALPTPERTALETQRLRSQLLQAANEELLEPRRRLWPVGLAAVAVAAAILVVVLRHPPAPQVARPEPVTSVATPAATVEPEAPTVSAPPPITAPPVAPHPAPPPLFDRGVASFRKGNYGLADDDLAAFVRANPHDPRCEDAAYLRTVARWRMGDREAATRLAREYLQAWPDGLRRSEIEAIASAP